MTNTWIQNDGSVHSQIQLSSTYCKAKLVLEKKMKYVSSVVFNIKVQATSLASVAKLSQSKKQITK
jgi:hypothetical protein